MYFFNGLNIRTHPTRVIILFFRVISNNFFRSRVELDDGFSIKRTTIDFAKR